MGILTAGTKVYLIADSARPIASGGEPIRNESSLANSGENVKDYYGDLRQPQKDVIFQPGDIIGKVTDKKEVKGGVLYYNVIIEGRVSRRTSHGWGAGTYEDVSWCGWVSSADISDDENAALSKFDKRTDKATLPEVRDANKNQKPPAVGGSNGSGTTPVPETKSKTGLIVGLSALGLAILGTIAYFVTRNR